MKVEEKAFHIAISFSGVDSNSADLLADQLQDLGLTVFYYKADESLSKTVGRDLVTELSSIYSKQCNYCLILCSKNYGQTKYTKLEREAALDAQQQNDGRFIIPISLDGSRVSGMPDTVAHLDMEPKSGDSIRKTAEIVHSVLDNTVNLNKVKKIDRSVIFEVSSDLYERLAIDCFERANKVRCEGLSYEEIDAKYNSVGKDEVDLKFLLRATIDQCRVVAAEMFSPHSGYIIELNSEFVSIVKGINYKEGKGRGGQSDIRILGCSTNPHRLEIESSEVMYNRVRQLVLQDRFAYMQSEHFRLSWSISPAFRKTERLNMPIQTTAFSGSGFNSEQMKGDYRDVVCHLIYIEGCESFAKKALKAIGTKTVKTYKGIRVFVSMTEEGIYAHSNFIKEGSDNPTKLLNGQPSFSLLDAFYNLLLMEWPTPKEKRELEVLHETQVEYFVDAETMKDVDISFYGGVQNIRMV